MILDEVDVESRELLARYDFDADAFDALRARLTSGELTIGGNVVIGTVEPPAPEDLPVLPAPGAPSFASAFEVGVDALRQGTIACVVLRRQLAHRTPLRWLMPELVLMTSACMHPQSSRSLKCWTPNLW